MRTDERIDPDTGTSFDVSISVSGNPSCVLATLRIACSTDHDKEFMLLAAIHEGGVTFPRCIRHGYGKVIDHRVRGGITTCHFVAHCALDELLLHEFDPQLVAGILKTLAFMRNVSREA